MYARLVRVLGSSIVETMHVKYAYVRYVVFPGCLCAPMRAGVSSHPSHERPQAEQGWHELRSRAAARPTPATMNHE